MGHQNELLKLREELLQSKKAEEDQRVEREKERKNFNDKIERLSQER